MRYALVLATALPLWVASGCTDHLASEQVEIIDLEPASGSANVALEAEVAITFSRRMDARSERYILLHETDVAVPPIGGTFTWSADGRKSLSGRICPCTRTRATYSISAPE